MLEWDRECLCLPSGHGVGANRKIIGINPDMELYTGYDSHLFMYATDEELKAESYTHLDEIRGQDRLALANYMIGLWTKWRDKDA